MSQHQRGYTQHPSTQPPQMNQGHPRGANVHHQHHPSNQQHPPSQQNAAYQNSAMYQNNPQIGDHQKQVKRLCDDLVSFYRHDRISNPPPDYNADLVEFLKLYTSLGYQTNNPSPHRLLMCQIGANPALSIGHGSGDMLSHLLLNRVPDETGEDEISVYRFGIHNTTNVSPASVGLHDKDAYEKVLQASLGTSRQAQSTIQYQQLPSYQQQQLNEYQQILHLSIRYPRPAPTMVRLVPLNIKALTTRLNRICAKYDLCYEQSIPDLLVEVVKSTAQELTTAVVDASRVASDGVNSQFIVNSNMIIHHPLNRPMILQQHTSFQNVIEHILSKLFDPNATNASQLLAQYLAAMQSIRPSQDTSARTVMDLSISHLLMVATTHPFWKRNIPLIDHMQSFR